jgi:deoxyribonuclease-4
MSSEIHYNKRIFAGSHVSYEGSIYNTLIKNNKLSMYSIQFFLGSYMSMNRSKVSDDDINKSNSYLKRYKINVFTHLPYVINLCGKNGEMDSDIAIQHITASINAIIYELNIISKIIQNTSSNGGCVLHIGSIGQNKSKDDRIKGLDLVIKNINQITSSIENGNSKLLLETMVGRGGVIGTSFEELKYIYDKLDNKDRIGICIDTCHIHAEGIYKLDSKENIDKLFEDFYSSFDKDVLQLIHLNDSCFEFNCGKDRHQLLFQGYIWKPQTLYYFLDKLEDKKIPYVLETDPSDYPLLQN